MPLMKPHSLLSYLQLHQNALKYLPIAEKRSIFEKAFEDVLEGFNVRQIGADHAATSTPLYPSHSDKHHIAQIMGVSLVTVNKWLQRERVNHRSRMMGEGRDQESKAGEDAEYYHQSLPRTKQLIQTLLSQQDASSQDTLSASQIAQLMKLSGFSRTKIASLVYQLRDHTGQMTEEKKALIREYWEERNSTENGESAFTSSDVDHLRSLTQCSRQQILDYIKQLRDPPGVFTDEKRSLIRQYVRNAAPNGDLPIDEIREETKLSRGQIHSYLLWLRIKDTPPLTRTQRRQIIQFIKSNSAPRVEQIAHSIRAHPLLVRKFIASHARHSHSISRATKRIIAQYIKEHGVKKTLTSIDKLQELTNLSTTQIKYLVRYLSDSPGTITREKRDGIREALKGSISSRSGLKQLASEHGLSVEQVRSVIRSLCSDISHLSKEDGQRIIEELELEQKALTPSSVSTFMQHQKKRIQQIAQKFHLNTHQMKRFIRNYTLRKSQTPITEELKARVAAFYETHGRDPSSDALSNLAQETNLSPFQIRHLIKTHQDTPGNITEEKREYIRDWLKDHQPPFSAEQRKSLQESLQLSRQQIYGLLRHSTGTMTEEKRNVLRDWYKTHQCTPTGAEMRSLCQQLELSPQQIRDAIASWDDPPGLLTESKKARLREWFDEHQCNPVGDTMDRLCGELSLSRKQVRNVLGEYKRRKRSA